MSVKPLFSGWAGVALALVSVTSLSERAFAQAYKAGPQLEAVHPGFDLASLRPDGWKPQVVGLDFMSDGRMVLLNFRPHEVYMVTGMETGDRSKVKWTVFASAGTAFPDEPLGMTVKDDTVFVVDRAHLVKLVDTNNDGVADQFITVCKSWGIDLVNGRQEFSYDLSYKNGYFYTGLGARTNPSGFITDDQSADRGEIIRIDPKTGKHEMVAKGFRAPNGLAWDADGELWSTDNQGSWLPANKLIHVKQGAFYGHYLFTRQATASDLKEVHPAVYLQEDEIGNSPGTPRYIPSGLYAGQFFIPDVKYGGIQRAYVEKVEGEYQGVAFRHSGGMEGGTHRIDWGPDGALYVGGIGLDPQVPNGTHSWRATTTALQRLKFNGKGTFEMLRVKSRAKGMEIHFTEPVGPEGEVATNYEVRSWYYQPTPSYGGPKMDMKLHPVKSVKLSTDRKQAYLEIDGLVAGRIVYIKPNVKSATGIACWNVDSYYALNAISNSQPFDPEPVTSTLAEAKSKAWFGLALRPGNNGPTLALPAGGAYRVEMMGLNGKHLGVRQAQGGETLNLTELSAGSKGLQIIAVQGDGFSASHLVQIP